MFNKIIKKTAFKVLGLFLLVFLNIDVTTFCESLDEISQNKETIPNETWLDWCKKYQFEISIGCGIIILAGLLTYFNSNFPPPKTTLPIDDFYLFNQKIDNILISIRPTTTYPVYSKFLEILTNFFDPQHPLSKEETLNLLKNMMENSYNSQLVLFPEEYVKKLIKLVEEIKKY